MGVKRRFEECSGDIGCSFNRLKTDDGRCVVGRLGAAVVVVPTYAGVLLLETEVTPDCAAELANANCVSIGGGFFGCECETGGAGGSAGGGMLAESVSHPRVCGEGGGEILEKEKKHLGY